MVVYPRSQSAGTARQSAARLQPEPATSAAEAPAAISVAPAPAPADLVWPFGRIDGLDSDDLRMTAYEIFFTACRSSPGFGGGRNSLGSFPPEIWESGIGSGQPGSPKGQGVGMAVTSKVKLALGLKMLRRSPTRRNSSGGSPSPSSPSAFGHGQCHGFFGSGSNTGGGLNATRSRRPMTSAEIMRLQMKVTEGSDNRLRKTLMRTLVGQIGKRAETTILPLELLRHLKPSEFTDPNEYHMWQQRQLKILEVGLLLHPLIPLDKSDESAARLREIIDICETRIIDTTKNSETMRSLCNCVVALAWRSNEGSLTDISHWADGYPFNIHLYIALLHSIFDLKDPTAVLDQVDELLELMKKTWSTLGINRAIHKLCFTWLLFEQYVVTGQVEPDLLGATLAMLAEVANDAKRVDREPVYVKMLASVLVSIKRWGEKRLVDYHTSFQSRGKVGLMETILPLVFSATKILEEDVPGFGAAAQERNSGLLDSNCNGNRVDQYIRSSLRNAFAKIIEEGNVNTQNIEEKAVSQALLKLAQETEDLAYKERENFSGTLKKWHPHAAGVAAMTLHSCYGTLLKQYLAGSTVLTNDMITVLQRAGKFEKNLVQMVVECSGEDGAKYMLKDIVPYEVESIIYKYLRQWIQERLKRARDVLVRAKDTETWNPKSKHEPHAQSAVELMKHAKEAIEDFFQIPIAISEDLIYDLADGLEQIFRDYTAFAASCGSKHSYLPTLPPLTRCNRDSKFFKLWRKASPCSVIAEDGHHPAGGSPTEPNHPRPSTSRGTQRLYIRLNTLHYLLSQLHSLDKTISLSPRLITSPRNSHRQLNSNSSYFDHTRSAIPMAYQHVSEVAAYRLIFLDSSSVFYGSLYVGDVENSRIRPALKILKQNLTLLTAIVTERAQPLAIKDVMKASFEAYLTVLLAGGNSRIFNRTDHEMIEEDFESLKLIFCARGEGFMSEDAVDREAEKVDGVVALMGQSTEQLIEDFSILACEANGVRLTGGLTQKLPMPPTTGKWARTDPNTILRILCHRNDVVANQFLKRTFQIAKRR